MMDKNLSGEKRRKHILSKGDNMQISEKEELSPSEKGASG